MSTQPPAPREAVLSDGETNEFWTYNKLGEGYWDVIWLTQRGREKMGDMQLLHIYPQAHEHGMAFIVGNTDALESLKAAIEYAIEHGQGEAMDAFTTDGEGFYTVVLRRDEGWDDTGGFWEACVIPYADVNINRTAKERFGPEKIVDWERIKRILAERKAARAKPAGQGRGGA